MNFTTASNVSRSSRRVRNRFIAGVCIFSLLAGCGVLPVKINGKPLMVGNGTEAAATAEAPASKPSKAGAAASSVEAKTGPRDPGQPANEPSKNARNLNVATRALRQEIDELVRQSNALLPAEKLSALRAKSKEFAEAKLDDQVAYLDHLSTYYALENGWRGDPSKSPELLASTLGGTVATSGELTGKDKPQSFKFAATEGHCYTVLMRMKSRGNIDEGLDNFEFDLGKDTAKFLKFALPPRRMREQGLRSRISPTYTYGVCASKTGTVGAHGTLKYAGSTNGLRYVVVDTPREKLPQYVAVEVEPQFSDGCDVENYLAMWMNPLPGAVLYSESLPLIPISVGQAEEYGTKARNTENKETHVYRSQLQSSPAGTLKFSPTPPAESCPRALTDARSEDGIKVATCYERLAKKYDPMIEAVEGVRDRARTSAERRGAEGRLEQIQAQFDREDEQSCMKIRSGVQKKFEAAHTKIVDFYTATPIKGTFDRAAALKRIYQGTLEITCDGIYNCTL
jgi:hypothetical protein